MDSPWITFAPADAHRDYHALLSVGYARRAKILSRDFWTLSVWEEQKALMESVARIPHEQAMRAMTPRMGSSEFTRWKVVGSSLPLSWNEALQRLQPGIPS